jgi:zinc transporter ZupT
MKIPLPRNYTIYQFWLVIVAMLSFAALPLIYLGHVVALFYFPRQSFWLDYVFAVLAVAVLVLSLSEVFTLRFYRKYRPNDEPEF